MPCFVTLWFGVMLEGTITYMMLCKYNLNTHIFCKKKVSVCGTSLSLLLIPWDRCCCCGA
jgi:hypothetical protein